MAAHSSILRSNASWKSRRVGWQSIRQSCAIAILFPPAPSLIKRRQAPYLMPATMTRRYRNYCGSLTMMRSNDGATKHDVSDGSIGIGLAAGSSRSGSNMGYVSLAQTAEDRRRADPKSGANASAISRGRIQAGKSRCAYAVARTARGMRPLQHRL